MIEKLNRLREAAEHRNIDEFLVTAQELLLSVQIRAVVELALSHVTAHLPKFEAYHPEVKWPRDTLAVISMWVKGESNSQIHTLKIEEDFETPGTNNFSNAVELLWEAVFKEQEPNRRVHSALDAIASVFMAQLVEYWGNRHLAEWQRWYQAIKEFEISGTATPPLLGHGHWYNEPEIVERSKTAWHSLVNEIEQIVKEFDGDHLSVEG